MCIYKSQDLKIRYFKYTVENSSFIIATNIFDKNIDYLADLYKKRWRVELSFKRLKSQLSIEKIFSLSEKCFLQDLQFRILLDSILRTQQLKNQQQYNNNKKDDNKNKNRKLNKTTVKKIILFGNGTFQSGGYGYAVVPKKKLIRNLASKKAIVIISDESFTSKVCPFCLKMDTLKDTEIENNNNTENTKKRIRQCTTETNIFCKKINHDRDYLSSINILQKSILNLMNKCEILSKFKK